MRRKILYIFIIFIFIFSTNSLALYTTVPVWSEDYDTTEVNADTTAENFLNIESESAILIEQSTGKILYEKDSHKQLRPASVTKIMTILLIMEALDRGEITLDTQIPCSQNAASMGGSQIWLNETESLTVDEMLKAICVVSANDCTVAMAEYLSGSEELFVQKMNDRAKELGMNDTTFKNCHGIDEDGHLTTSYDIALMSKELLQNHPEITRYTTIWMDSLRDGKSELVNTNKLIRTYEGATGLKTGSTSLALYNLSASATKNNLSLIAVVLRAPTPKVRFSEAKLLLDYGFNIEIGENFYSNHNLVILDANKVKFGDNVFIGPNCGFYTSGHPLDYQTRNKPLEYAKPITIGNNVWIGGNVCVMPGVTIGSNTVIGAGSVVTKDIPDNVVAVGNPCKVIRNM